MHDYLTAKARLVRRSLGEGGRSEEKAPQAKKECEPQRSLRTLRIHSFKHHNRCDRRVRCGSNNYYALTRAFCSEHFAPSRLRGKKHKERCYG